MKILVVVPEPGHRENLSQLLRLEGFEPLEAANGVMGLALARQYLPSLILSEGMMPELDGYGFLDALRADPTTASIPFIFLAAHADRAQRRRAMNLGADDFLEGPCIREEVVDAVHARIKRMRMLEKAGLPSTTAPTGQPPALKGYRMLRRLGAGGMSEVFLAARESDGLEVAVKLLDTRINQDASLLERFIQEYALLEQIEHPNVARIFAHGFTDEHAFITMEYFAHGDIKRRIASGFSPFEALSIALQVAYALSQIHALGIVHRDVKPDNLMLRQDGSVALIDFGVAKHAARNLEHTLQGEIVGSPYYLSPEQAAGKPVSPASDIYSLGVIFYEMVTGKRPYAADSMEALLYQHVHSPPPRLEPKLGEFQHLLDQMMHKDPARRFASAQALADYIVSVWPTMLRLMQVRALPHGVKAG